MSNKLHAQALALQAITIRELTEENREHVAHLDHAHATIEQLIQQRDHTKANIKTARKFLGDFYGVIAGENIDPALSDAYGQLIHNIEPLLYLADIGTCGNGDDDADLFFDSLPVDMQRDIIEADNGFEGNRPAKKPIDPNDSPF